MLNEGFNSAKAVSLVTQTIASFVGGSLNLFVTLEQPAGNGQLHYTNKDDMGEDASILSKIRQQMTSLLDVDDLRLLCFDLHVDFDSLRGESKPVKIEGLIRHMGKTKRLDALLTKLREVRPAAAWPSIPSDFVYEPEQARGVEPPTPKSGPTFNLGNIEAGVVNVGGEQTITGPIEVDMREQIATLSSKSAQRRAQIALLRKQLEQSGAAPRELKLLIGVLLNQIETASLTPKESQPLLNRLEGVVEELVEPEPDADLLRLATKGLARAAEKLPDGAEEIKRTLLQIGNEIQ